MSEQEFQSIHEVGLRALLKKLAGYRGASRDDVAPAAGDGAAIVKPGKKEYLLAASGIFIEGVHFDLTYTPLEYLGYKLVTAVASKIFAMNAAAAAARPDLAVPNKLSAGMVEQIYSGFDKAGKSCGCRVVPGEITASRQVLALSVHVSGRVPPDALVQSYPFTAGESDPALLLEAIGRKDLIGDPRFETREARVENEAELEKIKEQAENVE